MIINKKYKWFNLILIKIKMNNKNKYNNKYKKIQKKIQIKLVMHLLILTMKNKLKKNIVLELEKIVMLQINQ